MNTNNQPKDENAQIMQDLEEHLQRLADMRKRGPKQPASKEWDEFTCPDCNLEFRVLRGVIDSANCPSCSFESIPKQLRLFGVAERIPPEMQIQSLKERLRAAEEEAAKLKCDARAGKHLHKGPIPRDFGCLWFALGALGWVLLCAIIAYFKAFK